MKTPRCAVIAVALLFAAGPAMAADRNIGIDNFERVRVEGPFAVTVQTGKSTAVKASGNRRAIDQVSADVQGRTLILRARPGVAGDAAGGPVTIAVTVFMLDSARISGSGSLTVDRMRAPRIALSVEGSAQLSVAALTTDHLDAALDGSGAMVLGGTARDAAVALRGTGSIDATKLITSDLQLNSQSAGAVTIGAKGTARVIASGSGAVTVLGKPACTVTRTGAGPVRCGSN